MKTKVALIVVLMVIGGAGVWLVGCDTSPDAFELQLKPLAELELEWEIKTGRVTIKSIGENNDLGIVVALDENRDGGAEQTYQLQINAPLGGPFNETWEHARVLWENGLFPNQSRNILIVNAEEPRLLRFLLPEAQTESDEEIVSRIGWKSSISPTVTGYTGYGISKRRTVQGVPIEFVAGKTSAVTAFDHFLQLYGEGARCFETGGSGMKCDSGGEGSTGCQISGGGNSCGVSCSGQAGSEACCNKTTWNCKCCLVLE